MTNPYEVSNQIPHDQRTTPQYWLMIALTLLPVAVCLLLLWAIDRYVTHVGIVHLICSAAPIPLIGGSMAAVAIPLTFGESKLTLLLAGLEFVAVLVVYLCLAQPMGNPFP
ncbi:hypothetical protein [Rubripirellula tenax]|uniref:hypothetical protein n=1 Tax=Rubripirellula tenax TaxID=2528015 RepID=UPI001C95DDB6|nr:hypothetical protein [Rubripirellula tenax]